MHPRAGHVALPEDLIDVDAVIGAYYDRIPDMSDPLQHVVFGTSGHRGSSLDGAFNEGHIVAITAAIVEYRRLAGTDGPLFIGRDTHALSLPAWKSALEVLAAAGVDVCIDDRDGYTPTPTISHAILTHNGAGTAQGVRTTGTGLADGIVVTPSHNPPRDGGFKYNPPHGGPADSDATAWIAARANEILTKGFGSVERMSIDKALAVPTTHLHDYMSAYVNDLSKVLDLDLIRSSGVRIGADPLGGASVDYWGAIGEHYQLDLTVVNQTVDPRWAFMTLDADGKIRMDCSSPWAMASLVTTMEANAPYDIATGNDADSDRHGIVTPAGLMNPNHYLAVAIEYLFGQAGQQNRHWPTTSAVGKTLVSSALIDRVVAGLNPPRRLWEVPVGFKWFVPGLIDGSVGFGGEESAGASFLRADGTVWTTDKDGIIMALLASEILARTGKSPSDLHDDQLNRYGQSWYNRISAETTRAEKAKLAELSPEQVTATQLAGQEITAKLTRAPGNDAPVGGLKVTTSEAWFAARPSGTEDLYKIYGESFIGPSHLDEVLNAAKDVVKDALT